MIEFRKKESSLRNF